MILETVNNGVSEHAYEEVMLLPPKQFRDAPSPACSAMKKMHEDEAGAVDNILYHIYESPSRRAAPPFSGQLKTDTITESFQGFSKTKRGHCFLYLILFSYREHL